MNDQTRNLNPTRAARVAMIIWGNEYSKQRGGSMDFWDSLGAERKRRCELVVEALSSDKSLEGSTGPMPRPTGGEGGKDE